MYVLRFHINLYRHAFGPSAHTHRCFYQLCVTRHVTRIAASVLTLGMSVEQAVDIYYNFMDFLFYRNVFGRMLNRRLSLLPNEINSLFNTVCENIVTASGARRRIHNFANMVSAETEIYAYNTHNPPSNVQFFYLNYF